MKFVSNPRLFLGELLKKRKPARSGLQNTAGFTLIEMMIVISIIALIAGFVTTNIMRRFDEAKMNAAKIQMKQLLLMCDDFKRVCGRYPTTEEGLEALISAPAGLNCKGYDPEGFIKGKKVPLDPWNDKYIYVSDGNKTPVLTSHSEHNTHKDVSSEDE
ncbi:MAG: type II secretion system protein GspG [Bdellovibrio sp.]|nr:type II secretion system protein GspG [Bdellovibrio sp.]